MLTPSQSQPCTLATDLGITGQQVIPFTFTNPLAGNTQVSNIIIDLTTSAVVATRRIAVDINDENGARRVSMQGRGVQAASQLLLHPLTQGETFVTAFGLTVVTSMPRGFYIRKDWTIVFRVTNASLGDTQRIMFQLLR